MTKLSIVSNDTTTYQCMQKLWLLRSPSKASFHAITLQTPRPPVHGFSFYVCFKFPKPIFKIDWQLDMSTCCSMGGRTSVKCHLIDLASSMPHASTRMKALAYQASIPSPCWNPFKPPRPPVRVSFILPKPVFNIDWQLEMSTCCSMIGRTSLKCHLIDLASPMPRCIYTHENTSLYIYRHGDISYTQICRESRNEPHFKKVWCNQNIWEVHHSSVIWSS